MNDITEAVFLMVFSSAFGIGLGMLLGSYLI